MATWTELLSDWANKALSVARLNQFFSLSGNMQVLRDAMLRTQTEGGNPQASGWLELTESSQYLVAAPTSEVRKVVSIEMVNTDPADTAIFRWSTGAYLIGVFQFSKVLAPGEGFMLGFPLYLNIYEGLAADVSTTCAGARAVANYIDVLAGLTEFKDFTGDSWTDLVEVPALTTYRLEGFAVVNTDATTQELSIQIIDESSNVKMAWSRSLGPSESWFHGCVLDGMVLQAGWKIQVAHGAAVLTGSAMASMVEV